MQSFPLPDVPLFLPHLLGFTATLISQYLQSGSSESFTLSPAPLTFNWVAFSLFTYLSLSDKSHLIINNTESRHLLLTACSFNLMALVFGSLHKHYHARPLLNHISK